MEADVRVDDHIRKTVVFVGLSANGVFIPYGTGFITVSIHGRDDVWQTIVTARHVIESVRTDIVLIRVNNNEGEARTIETKKDGWFFHTDKHIDVAVYPTFIPKDQFDILHFQIGTGEKTVDCSLNAERIEQYQIGVGDEVYITGMFVGHLGEKKNLPIIRIGTIAAMPEEPLQTQYGTHDAFLIEARSIDGLSGSPVCINTQGRVVPYTMPVRPLPLPSEPRYLTFLAGMVLGYNEVINPRDAIEIVRTRKGKKTKIDAIVPMNTGIAVVLPIWRIIEAIEQPAIEEIRSKILDVHREQSGRRFVPTSAAPIGLPQ
jgi:hypothetical protein